MQKKLVKVFTYFCLILTLLFFRPLTAFAASDYGTPYDYVFCMALRSIGLFPNSNVAVWENGFKTYLETTGNTAMLARLEFYEDLSWGDTAPDIDVFIKELKSWVMQSDAYLDGKNNLALPAKPAPLPTAIGISGVQTTPFTDVAVPTDVDGYTYAFSYAYTTVSNGGFSVYSRRNVYFPENKDTFGIARFSYSGSTLAVTFYAKDATNVYGYTPLTAKFIETSYRIDTGAVYNKYTKFSGEFDSRNFSPFEIMCLPFPVFYYLEGVSQYIETGEAYNCFTSSTCVFNSSANTSVASRQVPFTVGDTLQLPEDASTAQSIGGSVVMCRGDNLSKVTAVLEAAGLNVSYTVDYVVEHYKEDLNGDWIKEKEETLSGTAGQEAVFTKENYPGFTLAQNLTEPKDRTLTNSSMVVKVYYGRDFYDYTIEHYKQDVDGQGWTLEETETLTDLYEKEAVFTPKDYVGFTYADSLTVPDSKVILGNNTLTIKLYYLRNLVSYTVEHYKQSAADEYGNQDWQLADTEFLSGFFGAQAAYTVKSYSGFTYQRLEPNNLTLPDSDYDLTVKLYYALDPVSYVVEYYTEDTVKSAGSTGWTLVDREILTGIPGMLADYPEKKYNGFAYNAALTEPSDRRIPSNGSLTVKLYYKIEYFASFKDAFNSAFKDIFAFGSMFIGFGLFVFLILFIFKFFKKMTT